MTKCDLGIGPIITIQGMMLLKQQNSTYLDAGYLDHELTGWERPFS